MRDNEKTDDSLAQLMGERLQQERMRIGLTQTALAEAIGVSRTSATLYEAGKHMPRSDVLAALDGKGIDVLFLLTGRRAEEAFRIDEEILAFAFEEAQRQGGKAPLAADVRTLVGRALPIYLALKQYRGMSKSSTES